MTHFAAKLAGAATLALAALPALALTTAAHAAPDPVKVRLADLDLLTPAGQAMLAQRVDRAGVEFCRSERSLTLRTSCRDGVRAEVREKLTAYPEARAAARTEIAVAR
ncbi:UrcA family protein [Phenylobacterium sp.]|uniref:UrcA family protein n=1 Tax=Phenylobacterium sp. TaxID=1871053 RepID=UPI002DF598A0|nr:UrcA family protein [Phenylobacterium sp.]